MLVYQRVKLILNVNPMGFSPLRWPELTHLTWDVAGRRKGPATAAVAQRSSVHRLWFERGATAPRPESPCRFGASNG